MKMPMTLSEIESGTFRPVPQCLNQLRQSVPHLSKLHTHVKHAQQCNATRSGTAARLITVTVCSIVLSRRVLFEQSTELQVFSVNCLTIFDSTFLSTLISLILFSQVKCAWKPQSACLAHLYGTSCRASLRGLEVRCSTPGRIK